MDINLQAPEAYHGGPPFEQFDWLRENDPVHWQEERDGGAGFWALTRHEDIRLVEQDAETFSNEPSSVINDDAVPNLPGGQKHLLMSDGPHHASHRKLIGPEMKLGSVREWTRHIDTVIDDVIDDVIERGECDFVENISGRVASYVLADMIGLPRAESLELFHAADILTRGGSKREGPGLEATQTLFEHASAAWGTRYQAPVTDMLGRLAHGEILGTPMDEIQFSMDFLVLILGGEDTTRSAIAGGMLALFENPHQRALVTENPDRIPALVDEILRWTTPITYMRRTATRDTQIGGREIKKGQKVVMYYPAANRDPSVFDNPYVFDIGRAPNPHISFGGGPHYCLGVHLAKAEMCATFREIFRRMPDIEPNGPAVWDEDPTPPTVVGISAMPVRFTPGPRVGTTDRSRVAEHSVG